MSAAAGRALGRRPAGGRLSRTWPAAALLVAGVVAVPNVVVLSSLATPNVDLWLHLWRTQLVELALNTLALLAGVGAGTLVVGTLLAWLVVHYRFPGRGVFEWALILPLAAEMTAGATKGARISWYDDCGHSPFFEHAERFNRELDEFATAIQAQHVRAHRA